MSTNGMQPKQRQHARNASTAIAALLQHAAMHSNDEEDESTGGEEEMSLRERLPSKADQTFVLRREARRVYSNSATATISNQAAAAKPTTQLQQCTTTIHIRVQVASSAIDSVYSRKCGETNHSRVIRPSNARCEHNSSCANQSHQSDATTRRRVRD